MIWYCKYSLLLYTLSSNNPLKSTKLNVKNENIRSPKNFHTSCGIDRHTEVLYRGVSLMKTIRVKDVSDAASRFARFMRVQVLTFLIAFQWVLWRHVHYGKRDKGIGLSQWLVSIYEIFP